MCWFYYDKHDNVYLQILGTPTEETWEGVTHYPNYIIGMYIGV